MFLLLTTPHYLLIQQMYVQNIINHVEIINKIIQQLKYFRINILVKTQI